MTRKIYVGGVPLGGGAPVSIQSMTNTPTHDVDATLAQIRALAAAGRLWLHPAVSPLLETLPGWLGAAAAAALAVDVTVSALLLRRRRDPACLRWYDGLLQPL